MITILFEHTDFFVVNKPAGVSVQDEQGELGVLHQVCQQTNAEKLWLVHRLDKVTSGCFIVARNQQAAAKFGGLFEQRQIEKCYLALSNKKPTKKQGTVIGGMKKIRDGKWALNRDNQLIAATQFITRGTGSGTRLFVIKPHTGRTHQIRVALKSLGSPITGDTLYQGEDADRAYLHAYALSFNYDNQAIKITAPIETGTHFLSDNVQQVIKTFGVPFTFDWPKVKLPKVLERQSS